MNFLYRPRPLSIFLIKLKYAEYNIVILSNNKHVCIPTTHARF